MHEFEKQVFKGGPFGIIQPTRCIQHPKGGALVGFPNSNPSRWPHWDRTNGQSRWGAGSCFGVNFQGGGRLVLGGPQCFQLCF